MTGLIVPCPGRAVPTTIKGLRVYRGIEMEDRWLSVDEICQYLGISRDTVYKWIDQKDMPAHRLGRLWKFRKEEVDEWVRSGGAGETKDSDSK